MELLTNFERKLKQRNNRWAATFENLSQKYQGVSRSRIIRTMAEKENISEQTIRVALLKMGVIKKRERKIRIQL